MKPPVTRLDLHASSQETRWEESPRKSAFLQHHIPAPAGSMTQEESTFSGRLQPWPCHRAVTCCLLAQVCAWAVTAVSAQTEDTLGQTSAFSGSTQDKQSSGGCVSYFSSVSWPWAREISHRRRRTFSLEYLQPGAKLMDICTSLCYSCAYQ